MNKDELIAIVTEDHEYIYEEENFDKIKDKSLIQFRNNINIIQSIRPTNFLEEKVEKYYESLIKKYNYETLLFSDYDYLITKIKDGDVLFFKNYTNFNHLISEDVINEIILLFNKNSNIDDFYTFLKKVTNEKVSEIVVEMLFKDNFYNVCLNIKELIRFHNSLSDNEKVLTEEEASFYNLILDSDKISCSKKIELFNKFKDKNINLIFYEDLRKIKDLSYEKINQRIIDIEKYPEFKKKDLSQKNKIDVYDLRDKEYFMLVSNSDEFSDKTNSKFGYYSLISNKNTDHYGRYKFLYGFSSFPIDKVLHVFEEDAGMPNSQVVDSLGTGLKKINRIMTPNEIVLNGYGVNGSYSEINILNNKTDNNNEFIKPIKPNFLVVIDTIEEKHIIESKRLNIPIVIIKKCSLEKNDNSSIKYKDKINDYIIDELFTIENSRKRAR